MENIAFDIWRSGRMEFSAEDKRACIDTARTIVNFAKKVRLKGMLSLDGDIPSIKDLMLQKALREAVDSIDPETTQKMLREYIVASNYKGRRLLEAL
ncbi:MAG: hypothetical protein FWH24_05015, partial [Oscillospiraceae bacterium]|nr:hypothetical protein [Oscillospiraceae bacterium]